MTDFSEFISALGGDDFDEVPVQIEEFVEGANYLNLPYLSPAQYLMVRMGTQIYRKDTLVELYGEEVGLKRFKETKNEVILALGKGCHIGTDEVYDAESGQWTQIKDMQHSYTGYVQGLNGIEQRTESFSKGYETVYKVTTSKGFSVTVSGDHKFMAKDGEMPLNELNVGDRIAVSSKLDILNPVHIDEDELKVLGYWLGDGMMPRDEPEKRTINVDFSGNDVRAIGEYVDIFTRHGDTPTVTKHRSKNMTFVRHPSRVGKYAFNIVNKYNLWGVRAHNKRVPSEVFSASDEQIGIFLGRLWGTDGCVYHKKNGRKRGSAVAEYTSVSYQLALDVQRLLLRLGIVSRLRSKVPTYTYLEEKRTGQTAYIVSISDIHGFRLFNDKVKMLDKQTTSDSLLEFFKKSKTQSHYEGKLYYDAIKSIKEVGSEEVFTLTATDTHFYNAGMIMNGNSGK